MSARPSRVGRSRAGAVSVAAILIGALGLGPTWAEPLKNEAKPEAVKTPEAAKSEAGKPEAAKTEVAKTDHTAAAAAATKDAPQIALELNKLEPTDKGCRVYMLTNNASSTAYPTYQLDLVLFQPDGVIARRIGIDIGPIKPAKRSLKLFDLDGLPCDRIGSMLVNEVLDCKSDSGALTPSACLSGLTLSALGTVKITK